MGAGRVLRLTAFLAITFAAGYGARIALAGVLPSPAVSTPTVSVTVPPAPTVTTPSLPVPTVTTPPLPTTSTPTPTQPKPPKPPTPPATTTSGTSGRTSSTPAHSGSASTGSPSAVAGKSGAPSGPGPSAGTSGHASRRPGARPDRSRASVAHGPTGGQARAFGGDSGAASPEAQQLANSRSTAAGSDHKEASGFTPAAVAGRASNPFVIAALAAAVILLGTAALPRAVAPSPRLTLALMEHRIAIAAAGAAALCSAIVALALP